MPLEIPTIASEATTIADELASEVGESLPSRSVIRTLAAAVAGSIISMYRFAGRRWLDMFARHASASEVTINGRTFVPLVELGQMLGVGDPWPANRAELQLTVTVATTGGSLPAGTILTNSDSGVTFVTMASVALDYATVSARVIAVEDPSGGKGYGTVGNLAVGAVVSFAAPISGVARDTLVAATLVAGSDGEPWESYRKRVHDARRSPPQGGAYADYRNWAKAVSGIEDAFPYPGAPGTVNVYVRATVASSGSADGIPTVAQRAAVLDYINGTVGGLASRRPINDGVTVLPITRTAFSLVVHGLAIADATAADVAITAACDEHLRTREPFIVGLSRLPRKDQVTNAELSGVVSQVVAALGGTVTSVVLTSASEDVLSYTLGHGEHAKLEEVTYEA